jgi:hypothetical protein
VAAHRGEGHLLSAAGAAARRLLQVGEYARWNTFNYRSDTDPSGFYRHFGYNGYPTFAYKPNSQDVYSKISGQPRFRAPF